jgi:hypothetical protein
MDGSPSTTRFFISECPKTARIRSRSFARAGRSRFRGADSRQRRNTEAMRRLRWELGGRPDVA